MRMNYNDDSQLWKCCFSFATSSSEETLHSNGCVHLGDCFNSSVFLSESNGMLCGGLSGVVCLILDMDLYCKFQIWNYQYMKTLGHKKPFDCLLYTACPCCIPVIGCDTNCQISQELQGWGGHWLSMDRSPDLSRAKIAVFFYFYGLQSPV